MFDPWLDDDDDDDGDDACWSLLPNLLQALKEQILVSLTKDFFRC